MGWRIYAGLVAIAVFIILLVLYCLCSIAGDEGQNEERTEEYFQKIKKGQPK
jgi:hypothetical protein